MPEIHIAVRGADLVPLSRLHIIQDDLKSLSKENYKKLRNEIVAHGFCYAIHVWDDGEKLCILDGTQRYRVVKEMCASEGYTIKGIPINYVEASNERDAVLRCLGGAGMYGTPEDEGLYALMIKHNITPKEIPNIELPGIELPSFEDNYFNDPEVEGEDEVPETPKEAKTKRGELWVLGNHRLLIDDCTVKENVERLMRMEGGLPGQCHKADMVFTDPPYGMNYQSNAWDSTKSDVRAKRTDKKIENDESTDIGINALKTISEFLSDSAHSYVWCRWDCFSDFLNASSTLGKSKGVIVWDKGGPGLGDLECSYGDNEWAIHSLKGRKPLTERQNSVWQVNRMKGIQMEHPTQKPVELCERAVKNSTGVGEIVADVFLGSGSTLIACEKTNRKCYGMEIEPLYGDVIIQRWEKFTGKEAVREDGVKFNEL